MRYVIEENGQSVSVEVHPMGGDRYRVQVGDAPAEIVDAFMDGGHGHLLVGTASYRVESGARGEQTHVQGRGLDATVLVLDSKTARRRARQGSDAGGGANVVRSPMPGRVVDILVAEGDSVTAGQGVAIVEAMKMENELRAEIDGIVSQVHVRADDRVEGNAELVTLAPKAED